MNEIYTFTRQGGGLSFLTNKKCLVHKIRKLKSNFDFMVGNILLCCISAPNFTKFAKCRASNVVRQFAISYWIKHFYDLVFLSIACLV